MCICNDECAVDCVCERRFRKVKSRHRAAFLSEYSVALCALPTETPDALILAGLLGPRRLTARVVMDTRVTKRLD
jgi:hypothetical protein